MPIQRHKYHSSVYVIAGDAVYCLLGLCRGVSFKPSIPRAEADLELSSKSEGEAARDLAEKHRVHDGTALDIFEDLVVQEESKGPRESKDEERLKHWLLAMLIA